MIKVPYKTNNSFNSTMMASFLPSPDTPLRRTAKSIFQDNSEQKEQRNKEKYVFYCSVSQIHINPEKNTKKPTKMTSSDVPLLTRLTSPDYKAIPHELLALMPAIGLLDREKPSFCPLRALLCIGSQRLDLLSLLTIV